MRRLETEDMVISYLEFEEIVNGIEPDEKSVIVVEVHSWDFEKKKILEEKGFCFHDRILNVEVGTKLKTNHKIESQFFKLVVGNDFDEVVKQLAHEVFFYDSRFHFDRIPNRIKGNKVIDAFLDNCGREGFRIVKCMHDNDLMGFIILKDNGNNTATNMLGAVKQDCHGKMSVPFLYGGTLEMLASEGITKEFGTISASNVASINLHFQLGGRLVNTTDKYIRRICDER